MEVKAFEQGGVSERQKSKGCFRQGACLLIPLAALALLYLFFRGAGAFLIHGDRLEPSSAVVSLGGGGEHRVEEAVRLINDRYGEWLILTEPGEVTPGGAMGSGFFRTVAIENGLSEYAIMITDGTQKSTYDEAVAVLELMQKHKMNSVIVVTDPFHTMRTRTIFRDVFKGSGLAVRVHPVPSHWYRSDSWFLSKDGWSHTLREYVKLIGYWTGSYHSLD